MGQTNTAWKQQKHMSKTIWANGYVSTWSVLFWPQNGYVEGKKGHLIFRHTQTRKKHVLQQWQWIVFGSAKPAQDEKTKTRRKLKPTNAKQQHTVIIKNVKAIVQNLTCQLHRLWNSEEFMWIRGCSLLMGVHVCFYVFFIFFGCHLFSLRSGFPCPKRKIKVFFREVRARFLGIKWLPPGARTQPKKQV